MKSVISKCSCIPSHLHMSVLKNRSEPRYIIHLVLKYLLCKIHLNDHWSYLCLASLRMLTFVLIQWVVNQSDMHLGQATNSKENSIVWKMDEMSGFQAGEVVHRERPIPCVFLQSRVIVPTAIARWI